MGTKLLAVRTAVAAGVAGLPEFTTRKVGVMVSYKATTARAFAYTRRGRYTHRNAGMRSGSNPRHESATFELVLWVQMPGKSGEDAAGLALLLGAAAESWVSANKQGAGVPGVYTLTIEGDGSLDDGQGDQGGLAEYVIPVHYDARLES